MHKDAQKTDAKQTNRNLLLTDQAQIDTKPQLEIYADDVKCTHGATIGQIDENALFYLRSRGIDEAAARSLLLYAFASECLDRMKEGPGARVRGKADSANLHRAAQRRQRPPRHAAAGRGRAELGGSGMTHRRQRIARMRPGAPRRLPARAAFGRGKGSARDFPILAAEDPRQAAGLSGQRRHFAEAAAR